MAELGFYGTDKLIWVQFNACYSAHTTEFPQMLGILPMKDPLLIGKQAYIGWYGSARIHDVLEFYNEFESKYWEYLRQGYNLETAVDWASEEVTHGSDIKENFRCFGVISWQYVRFMYPNIN
jgi:hypothetical protein